MNIQPINRIQYPGARLSGFRRTRPERTWWVSACSQWISYVNIVLFMSCHIRPYRRTDIAFNLGVNQALSVRQGVMNATIHDGVR
jgi:hypothetical protein